MPKFDLSTIVGNDIRVLIGQDRGLAVRNAFGLDQMDLESEPVTIVIPSSLRTLTPSFVQGFVAGSVSKLGESRFYEHYRFDAPADLKGDIRAGVDRVLTSRHLAGVG